MRNRRKVKKEDIYNFLIDKENKSLIIAFSSFIVLVLIMTLGSSLNFFLKLLLYYVFYAVFLKKYDKVVNFLFRDIYVNSDK